MPQRTRRNTTTDSVDTRLMALSDHPLALDTCQRIHYEALRNMSNKKILDTDLGPSIYGQNMMRSGPEAFLLHPEEVRQIFQHVTIGVYRLVEGLFCSRENRAISMVTRIVDKTLQAIGQPPVDPLAIWSICMFLIGKRAKMTEVTKHFDDEWFIARVDWNMTVTGIENARYQPSAVLVSCPQKGQVLSIEIVSREQAQEKLSLAIYQALLSKRIPSGDGAAGLIWHLPRRISSNFALDERVEAFITKVGIGWDVKSSSLAMLGIIQAGWEDSLVGRNLPDRDLELILDRFISRHLGYSPQSARKTLETTHKNSIGLERDPLWQYPDLRLLFEKQHSPVDARGIVQVGHLQYTNSLLALWKNENVDVIVSPTDRHSAWVYEQTGDLICQATRFWSE